VARPTPELRTRVFARTGVVIAASVVTLCAGAATRAWGQASQSIPVGPTVSLDYEYYDVTGRDATEVLRALRANGPGSDGETYFGLTTAQTGFSYQLVPTESGCAIQSLGVKTEIVVTLPRWDPPRGAPEEVWRQWEAFRSHLMEHELWHAEVSRLGTHETYRAVRGMTGASCRSLDRRARAEFGRIQAQVSERNEQYDRMTDHGRRNGVVWRF